MLCFSYRTLKLSREKERERLYLDLDFNTLERQCQEINYLLIEKKLFLRVCELKKKFRYLLKKGTQKSKVQIDLSVYIEERSDGFEIVEI